MICFSCTKMLRCLPRPWQVILNRTYVWSKLIWRSSAHVFRFHTSTPALVSLPLSFAAPIGLNVELRTSAITTAVLDTAAHTLTINLDAAAACVTSTSARIVISVPTHPSQTKISGWKWATPASPPPLVRGAFELPCATATIVLGYTPTP